MKCAVEMAGRGKPPAVSHRPWKSLRDSPIPTASTATIHQSKKKGAPLEPYPTPPGSFLDEKMLKTRRLHQIDGTTTLSVWKLRLT